MNNRFILDSSAVLAIINLEPGHEHVEPLLDESAIGTINVAEVLAKLTERGVLISEAYDDFIQLGINVVPFEMNNVIKTAELRPLTRHLGLSLGDRACLALAIQEKATAVTADRKWSKLDVCKIEVIR
ncbi:MAG: type II toxin-antitoxin system VapC family toxin [Pyrinomonadaceae bacterium]